MFHMELGQRACLQPTVIKLSSIMESSPHVLGSGFAVLSLEQLDYQLCPAPHPTPLLTSLHSAPNKKENKQEHSPIAQALQDHSGLKNLIFLRYLTMSSGVSPICNIINFLYLLFHMNLHIQLSFYLISHGFATLTKTF